MWSAIAWIESFSSPSNTDHLWGPPHRLVHGSGGCSAGLIAPGDPLRLGTYALHPPSGYFPLLAPMTSAVMCCKGIVHGARTSLAVGLLGGGHSGTYGGTGGRARRVCWRAILTRY